MPKYTFLKAIPLLFILFSCTNNREHPINFYHWKSNVSFDSTEISYFERLHSKTLYIRLFDVDDSGNGASPIGKIEPFSSSKMKANYVPVVFITNRTFQKKSLAESEQLAEQIYKLLNDICNYNGIKNVSEINIDCDWTPSTRLSYFHFLKQLKEVSQKDISATLRLHQIKYKKDTGVPPIDKGYVMCYATSNPTEENVENSILDINLLKDYLETINEYPLKVDFALPIYSWAVITNHVGKVKLLNGVTKQEMNAQQYEHIGANQYRIKENLTLHGMYLNEDFRIRIEEISPEKLLEAKSYLDKKLNKDYSIIYYHLDSQFLKNYSIENLK